MGSLLNAYNDAYNSTDPEYRKQEGLLRARAKLEEDTDQRKLMLAAKLQQINEENKLMLEKQYPKLVGIHSSPYSGTVGYDENSQQAVQLIPPNKDELSALQRKADLSERKGAAYIEGMKRLGMPKPAAPMSPQTRLQMESNLAGMIAKAYKEKAIPPDAMGGWSPKDLEANKTILRDLHKQYTYDNWMRDHPAASGMDTSMPNPPSEEEDDLMNQFSQ